MVPTWSLSLVACEGVRETNKQTSKANRQINKHWLLVSGLFSLSMSLVWSVFLVSVSVTEICGSIPRLWRARGRARHARSLARSALIYSLLALSLSRSLSPSISLSP